jgi:hypothetical protein
MLVAHLLDAKQAEKQREVTRALVSDSGIRRMFRRQLLTLEFLNEVQNWLADAGWAMFKAGSSYAVVRLASVQGWSRISTKRISDDLTAVATGNFDFSALERLLLASATVDDDE